MNNNNQHKSINPTDLPESEIFIQKEIYQYKQPGDSGKPLYPATKETGNIKEDNKSSKEEGLNEKNSAGNNGAYEGFENPQEK